MVHFAFFLTIAYLAYLLYEKRRNDKYLASFQQIIHVNGIRGKTSVCRLIDAALRGSGYRVFTKTTGTTPFYIDTDGIEHLINRRGNANINEQLRMIKRAYSEHSEILIIECMAVNPELQKFSQEKIVKGTLNVITNVRYDHVFEMGETLDEIAESLSNTIPKDGVFFTSDSEYYAYFENICQRRNTRAILCKPDECGMDENHTIAFEVCKYFGISKENFVKKTQNYLSDFGAHKYYESDGIRLLNLFSVNDPQSTQRLLLEYVPDSRQVIFVYNHRTDRPDRFLLFLSHFFPCNPCERILIIGENTGFCCRLLKKKGISQVQALSGWRELLQWKEHILVGVGNIKGDAYELINYLEEDASHE